MLSAFVPSSRMLMHTMRTLLVLLMAFVLPSALHAQALPAPVVDVNGPHIVLNNGAPRDWNNLTVELNGYWEYKVVGAPQVKSLCINPVAFVPLARVRAGGDYTGIHFDPKTMNVKSATVTAPGGRPTSLRVTKGLIKPLTAQEAKSCVGSAPK